MSVWTGNIEQQTIRNRAFRRVIATGRHQQLVLMSIPPGSDIGLEKHPTVDQFLRIEKGRGYFVFGSSKRNLRRRPFFDGGAMFVPAGTWHNVVNVDRHRPLQVYTLYAPPEHEAGEIQMHKRG
jgi:mannose-6-phosphate isomerase-like protein (cupin superfamily)